MAYSYRRLIFSWILKILLTYGWVKGHTDAQCGIGDEGGFRFGPDCSFSCHCLNPAEQCDWKTGDCVSGCDWEWAGQGCQYKNIAFGLNSSRHIDNLKSSQPKYADLANDADLSTCSETGDENTKRDVNPWWKIWFSKSIIFKQLRILTKKDKLGFFKSFNVSVENVPVQERLNKDHYPERQAICYKQQDMTPDNEVINVKCQRHEVGNQLRIQLGTIRSQLVICDIRIVQECDDGMYGKDCENRCSGNCLNGEICIKSSGSCPLGCEPGYYSHKCDKQCEDGTYGKNCGHNCSGNCFNDEVCLKSNGRCPSHWCKGGFKGDQCDQICDEGTYGPNCVYKCSGNCFNEEACIKSDGSCPQGCKTGFMGDKCENKCVVGFYGEQCSQPCDKRCSDQLCDHVDGSCTRGCQDGWKGPRCDTDCDDGTYGISCISKCSGNCFFDNEVCDKFNGSCPKGCKPGYRGNKCDHECAQGSYGEQCKQPCGMCLDRQCDKVDGICTYGCQEGWNGPLCDKECEDGTYGKNCVYNCTGNCFNERMCVKSSGNCLEGCKPGFTGYKCDQDCRAGYYGAQCRERCSSNCLQGNLRCNKVNGECLDGCKNGWKIPKCDQECEDGTYGKNCGHNCSGNCYNDEVCLKSNGWCASKWCKHGFKGDQCDQICDEGTYGPNCKHKCSGNCFKEEACIKSDGSCPQGCKTGFMGNKCENKCAVGFYGEQCSQPCDERCSDQRCDHVDGSCTRGCQDGWKGPRCETECDDGTYGNNCRYNCSGNCFNDEACVKSDGSCPKGCKRGYTGSKCEYTCTRGFYGANCEKQCDSRCFRRRCHHVNGICEECQEGWKGQSCDKECEDGKFGKECAHNCTGNCLNDAVCVKSNGMCPGECKPGFTGGICDQECREGSYGAQCKERCSSNCLKGYKDCNHVDGECTGGCQVGWKMPNCDKVCEDGTYGKNCGYNCSGNCFYPGACNKTDGRCPRGRCKPGFMGNTCDQTCPAGLYGEQCLQECNSHCLNKTCNHVDGECTDGCQDGWENPKCDKECEDGTYGQNCRDKCSGNCLNEEMCVKSNGMCPRGCKPGYKEDRCDKMCLDGYFGMHCVQECSEHCAGVCDNVGGTCSQCEHGWKGSNCTTECDDGSYGKNCSNSCGPCKDGSSCHKTNGTCPLGCTEGFKGHDCMQALKLSETAGSDQGLIGGIVAILVIAALIGVVLLLRRHTRKQRNRNSNVDKAASTEEQLAESQGFNTYSNAAMVENNRTGKQVSEKVNAKNTRKVKGTQMEMMQAKDKLKQGKEDNTDVYYNTGPMTKQRSQSAIRISDFGAYVKSGLSNKDFFFNEFQKIPYGSVHSTQIAKKPGNAKKNRYKDMYAYDHSRVILNKLPDDPDSDYINASYIRGNVAERAYIAAQGPTDFNVNDFWRMVLEKDVHTIVMVTNLVEETKMKCIQYWAEVGDTKTYGPISIYTERECVFAEYTVRKFTVTQADKPEKSHKVKHYNYTAWPDKDVPKSTSSLLHFWRRVRQNEKTRPWLVHCSAGVGRTGTFVAIDVLYDQGKDLGFLDVYQCVRDLRDQRVNMVQTKEQYKYLHSIMTEIFVLPSQPIKLEELNVVYRDLKEVDRATGKTKLLLEYETLRDEPSNALQEEESSAASASTHKAESIYSCAKLSENKRKNRYDNILASNEYRPFLATDVKGCTNYINAVYISSYCDLHGFILTQTPMKHTVVDLYRLILEQEVKVVVTFDDHTVEEVGKCFPEDGSVTPGPFTMTFVSESCNQNLYTRIHTLKYQKKEQKVLQVVFKQWQTEVPVPPDPYKMYSFLQDIEKLQKQHEQKPVILSCLNGAEKSGLIAVLINILERARFDGEVSIPQVIRQLRVRRQQIIPNFDQYKLCYDVLLCHAETNATYANM